MPDAGGLVIASDQTTARAYAALLGRHHGRRARRGAVRRAGRVGRIARFVGVGRPLDGRGPNGVSEGVDVPRLAVGVTPRARRRRCSSPRRSAGSCGLAAGGGDGVGVRAQRCRCCWGWPASWRRSATTCSASRTALRSSGTTSCSRGRSAHGGRAGGGREGVHRAGGARRARPADLRGHIVLRPDEEDYLGLPGLLAPDQVRTLLNQRQTDWLSALPAAPRPPPRRRPAPPRQMSVRERIRKLRKELNTLVALHNHRTSKPHGVIHSELRAHCGGPPTGDGDHRAARGAHRDPAQLALRPVRGRPRARVRRGGAAPWCIAACGAKSPAVRRRRHLTIRPGCGPAAASRGRDRR